MKLFGFIEPSEETETKVLWSGEWPCTLYEGAEPNKWTIGVEKISKKRLGFVWGVVEHSGEGYFWGVYGYNGAGHSMGGGMHDTREGAIAAAQRVANELLDPRGLIRLARSTP